MRRLNKAGLVLLPIACGVLIALDDVSFNHDVVTCRSDNLFVAKELLDQYRKTHGALPADEKQFAEFARQQDKLFYLHCNTHGGGFEWRPGYAKDRQNEEIILTCPRASHGFIRKFSWALAFDGSELGFVRLLPDGSVIDK